MANLNTIDGKAALRKLENIYGEDDAPKQQRRYKLLAQRFVQEYKHEAFSFFSAPGRIELIGNHTDHNHGCVLAAGINLDAVAAAAKNNQNLVCLRSEGYNGEFVVDLSDLAPKNNEIGTTSGIIRGILARFLQLGLKTGGFDAYVHSNVLGGSGLSSSAAIEVLICTILSHLFNDGQVSTVELARISQYAENVYFGKPCGLMDQMASAAGSILFIDFADSENIKLQPVKYDFAQKGYSVIITNVRSDHANLTDDYAAITKEMGAVAQHFGKKTLREVNETSFYNSVYELYGKVPDRAILRAMHFFNENKRVEAAAEALTKNDLQTFFNAIISSGNSSWRLLQNLYSTKCESQALPVALAVTENLLRGKGAWRVHGGGFGGTTLAFVPEDLEKVYISQMNRIFGEDAAIKLAVRPCGAEIIDF